ncbi:iron chaperone [Nocardia tengchongensis]|uniref:iron chaperone n=1 Tax=Nocardia tengchongensis TaxID=2055889 RepID=UPI00365CA104
MAEPQTVDEYLAAQPAPAREALERVRATIRAALPGASETISYQIPAVAVNGATVMYFAGWKSFVSVYPVPSGDDDFQQAIAPYLAGKGTLKFPLRQPIPYDLISDVAVRLAAQRAPR